MSGAEKGRERQAKNSLINFFSDFTLVSDQFFLRSGETTVSLDSLGGDVCYVSHAHSDHSQPCRTPVPLIASPETYALTKAKGKLVSLPGVTLHNAGHIFGSTQIRAEQDGRTVAYTGDFKLRDGLTTKKAEIIPCDTLIIEGTYGREEYSFQPPETLYEQMAKWCKRAGAITVFGAYRTGKAQEMIKFFNEYLGVAPLVDKRIAEVAAMYQLLGEKLDYLRLGTEEAEEAMRDEFFAILPHHNVNYALGSQLAEAYGREVRTALVTGWAQTHAYPVDKVFPLSDHADFSEIVEYCEHSGAGRIYCCHGEDWRLARTLRNRGFSARALAEANGQQQLLI